MIPGHLGSRLVCEPGQKANLVLEGVLRQYDAVLAAASEAFKRPGNPLTPALLRELHERAVGGIYSCAGHFRDFRVSAGSYLPPESRDVPGHVEAMCDYLGNHWDDQDAVVLSAYTMWRVNWIHPFGGGNGRTSRAASYLVLLAKHGSLLPGDKPIPQRLVEGRRADYIAALKDADAAWAGLNVVDVAAMADLLAQVLTAQLADGSVPGSQ